jgi:DNA polymerase III subunit alpha
MDFAMADDFVHIHTHSEYSLLDGLGRVKDLVKEAKRLGQSALAITDHGTMHGAIEFFRACKDGGIRPIIGVESYQTVWGRPKEGRDPQFDKENYHQLLIAKNMTGYRNLLNLVSQSHINGFYYKPRLDHTLLEKHAEGLICTTGCLGAEVPQLLMQGKEKEAYERLGWYVDLFGKENFFIELQEHSIDELKEVNKTLVPWADKFGLQLLVTNDVHYVREADSTPHEVLLCVQTGTRIQDEKRMRLSDQSYFLKSRAQMEATFRPLIDLPSSAYDSSVHIAEMCEVDLEDPTYHLPELPIPEGFTYASYLRHLTELGLRKLYGDRADEPEVQERKERELRIIGEMGFDVYFLIVADLCDFARSRGIWWNVRGSGAGSLVAYCTGITGLDPLKNNLIFERFLNPGRVTMPDFDLDYPDDQREEMIRYTVEKYGSEQVAQIVTFGRMKARAAIRDVGRAKDISLDQVDRIAKLVPAIPGKPVTIRDVLTEGNEFYNPEMLEVYQKEAWVRDLLDTSMQLEGVARHAGIHAAAVIVADRPLEHYTPLMRGTKATLTGTITQYEFPILESIGLLKVDFLGLSTLTVLREACRLIKEQHGIEYRLDNIPFEGEEAEPAFKLLSSGEVAGVFQVESQGMRRVLTEMRPSTFEHIVATISLYRPGPLEYIPQFIRRMHGEEEVVYKHPAQEALLAETYGIIVYQEQIIQILSELAGYTPGEADLVRRAIGKKKASEIERHKQLFIEGCKSKGIEASIAADIYADIEFFARYGFNKSHAADYAVITVQTAYLKALYPVEYMAALLLVERDKTEKVVNFINECRRMGIQVLPPDVNYSDMDFTSQAVPADSPQKALTKDPSIAYDFPVPPGAAIRFGMAAVKNVGEGPVSVILESRKEGGPFRSLEDFCDRVDLRHVNKRSLECLIKVGALDRFGHRRQLLTVLEQLVARSASSHSAKDSGQISMFDLMGDAGAPQEVPIVLPAVEDIKSRERLQWEKELLGVYASSHPVQQLKIDLMDVVTCSCAELGEEHDDKVVTIGGMISDIRTTITKKGDKMAFLRVEDLLGQCEVVLFPRTYEQYKDQLEAERVILVIGKAQARNGRTSVLAEEIKTSLEIAHEVINDENRYQEKLIDMPTFNGKRSTPQKNGHNGNNGGNNGHNGEMDGYDLSNAPVLDEPDPFANEMPDWLVAEMAANGEPVTERKAQVKDNKPSSQPVGEAHPKAELPLPPQTDGGESTVEDEEGTVDDTLQVTSSGETPHEIRSETELPALKEENLPLAGAPALEFADKQEDASPVAAPVEDTPEAAPATQQTTAAAHRRAGNGYKNGHTGHRMLKITFSRSGQLDRDKYRLREIVETVRDPKGRDQFMIVMESDGKRHQLNFPNEFCNISDRLVGELHKYFNVDAVIDS